MTGNTEPPTWWDLHLRQARGEPLSESEQQRYEAEMARQDRDAPLRSDLELLRQLRARAADLAQENSQLRKRAEHLENQIRTVEQALSRQTRQLLGVRE